MEKILKLANDEEAIKLYGSLDENLRFAEEKFQVKVFARNRRLSITGEEANVLAALEFFSEQLGQIRTGGRVEIRKEESARTGNTFFHKGKIIRAKTPGQEEYIQKVNKDDIVFAIGPAGTGKTYLAVAFAVDYLKHKKVSRIILTRPAVEAGESLGFLPGDFYAKINPYLKPLYDALYDMMDAEEVARYMQRGTIEVAPLAYMRGRTLNDAFVILDEGQNTTHDQMKMLLTRLGVASKAVITGDVTQVDLPKGKLSGLKECQKVLKGIEGISFVYLSEKDVVRHRLVRDIVNAYEKHAERTSKEYSV